MDFETLHRRLLERVNGIVQNGDMTERGLARMIGISQPHMHHILKGARTLSVDTADRLLRRLNLSVTDLLAAETVAAARTDAGVRLDIGGLFKSPRAAEWDTENMS